MKGLKQLLLPPAAVRPTVSHTKRLDMQKGGIYLLFTERWGWGVDSLQWRGENGPVHLRLGPDQRPLWVASANLQDVPRQASGRIGLEAEIPSN